MSLFRAKQIAKFNSAWVGLTGFAAAGATSDTLTTALTGVLSTAGDGGLPVPLQAAVKTRGSQVMGVLAAAPDNICTLFDGVSGLQIQDANGHDVYGRITVTGAVWTLGYFVAPGGVEAPYAMPAGQVLSIDIPYLFSFDLWPQTAGIGSRTRHAAPDAAAYGWREFSEQLTVTGANALSALTNAPDGRKTTLNVNGVVVPGGGASPAFTVAGKSVTWSAANAGYALDTSDTVFATYTY